MKISPGFYCWFIGILLCLIFNSLFYSAEIIEKVDVEETIFSQEFGSKNLVIITQKDLEQLKIRSFSDLFSFFSILNVNKRGQSDSTYDLSLRGSNFEQILVLVNGIPVNNPQTGHFNSAFPLIIQDIERIEIIKGGSSTTYGAGAFAGVVNIIIKKGSNLHVSISGGEKDFLSSTISVGKLFKNLIMRFSFQKSNSSGFYPGREFDQVRLSAFASYQNKKTEINFYSGYLGNDFGASGFYADYDSKEKIDSFFSHLAVRRVVNKITYSINFALNSWDDFFVLNRFDPDLFQNQSLSKQSFFNFSGSYRSRKILTSLGIEYKQESMDSSSMGFQQRKRGAVYLNTNYFSKNTGMDLGIRSDFITDKKANLNFYAGFYTIFSPGFILKANCSKSFRIPSFTELYYKSPANIGDPDLKPEDSYNFEGSISMLKNKQSFDLSLFYRNQKNVIDWIKNIDNGQNEGSVPWEAKNIEKNDITGFELSHCYNGKKIILKTRIEKLFVIDKNIGFLSKYGLQFPDFSIKANLLYKISESFSFVANYLFKRIHQTRESGHFLNFVFSFHINKIEFRMRIENVFNNVIEEIPGIKIPGRWVYFSLIYR